MTKVKKALSIMLIFVILSTIGGSVVYGKDLDPVNVRTGSGTAFIGGEITIPITFLNVPSAGINNCDFEIEYDSNAFEVVSVSAGNIVEMPIVNFGYYNDVSSGKGIITFCFVDGTFYSPIVRNGTFANIKFRIKNTAPPAIYRFYRHSVGAFATPMLESLETVFSNGGVFVPR